MQIQYLATTESQHLPNTPLLMVDGTIPGWQPQPHDHHWDHHRPGGAPIQIDEMPLPINPNQTLLQELLDPTTPTATIATTLVDADACIAATWLQLPGQTLQQPEVVERLRAIAFDCDHLSVPQELSHLADFAAQAVAILTLASRQLPAKLGYPATPSTWSTEQRLNLNAIAFEQGTNWLLQAAQGQTKWPGTQGEAVAYWQQVNADTAQLLQETDRLQLIQDIPVFDLRGIDHPVDPRACLQASRTLAPQRPETLTIKKHRLGGVAYILGCDPAHPLAGQVNYCPSTYEHLTTAETQKSPTTTNDPWGGRKSVGGSGWNTASQLTPEEVITVVLAASRS
jgi:hypothetical protein